MSFIANLISKPSIAHLLRTNQRYGSRLGSQFAAAVTYFSVLSLVPILMFAFAGTGFVLTVVQPDLLDTVRSAVADALGSGGDSSQLTGLIDKLLSNWQAVGIIGLLSSVYTGAGWTGNLKSAVRAQWRADFNAPEKKHFIVIEVLINLAIMVGLLAMILVTFALASAATFLTDYIVGWLDWQRVPGISVMMAFAPVLASIVAGWVLFVYLYRVMPDEKVPFGNIARGALIGSIGLGVLQYLMGFLMGRFAENPAAAVFGPVIVLMLFFNLFAQLILFLAAWIATARPESADDACLDPRLGATVDSSAYQRRHRVQVGPDEWFTAPEPDPKIAVGQDVAAQAVKVGLAAGYLAGAATGVGLGAVIVRVLAGVANRRRRKAKRCAAASSRTP